MWQLLSRCVFAIVLCGAITAKADDVFIFTANWCEPCQKLKRALAENPAALAPHNIAIFDIAENKELADMYAVKTVPTILHFTTDGKIRRHTGFKSLSQIQQWFDNNTTGVVRRLLRR